MEKWAHKTLTVGAILASAFLTLSLGACAGGQGQSSEQSSDRLAEQMDSQAAGQGPIDTSGGSPWIDSNIKDNIKPDMKTSPKDDYYLYANYDWLLNTDIPEGDRVTGVGMGGDGPEHVAAAIAGEELEGHDARQAQLLYRATIDTVARDAAGVEPARETVEAIRSLATIDDVSAFLLDTQKSAGVPTLLRPYINQSTLNDDGYYVPCIALSPQTFGSSMGTIGMDATSVSPEDDLYQARLACASEVLTRLGLSEDEAKAAFEHRVELEKRIVEGSANATAEDEVEEDGVAYLKPEELDGMADAFPLRQLVKARGYGKATEYLVKDKDEIRAACALYTQDNIELVRDYLLVGYALEASGWLDSQAFEAWRKDYVALGYYDQLGMTQTSPEDRAVYLVRSLLPTPAGRAYAEAYDLTHTKEFMNDFCKDAIEAHKEVVNASEWLSDSSKRRLCEKLDAIDVQAVYPEAWEDYSGLELEGLSYYEARRAIWLFDVARNAALTGTKPDTRLWLAGEPTLTGTAHYEGRTNSFIIPAGSVEGDVARYEAGEISLSEFMGGPAGYLVFHEIGHALDPADIKIGPHGEGVEESLLEPDDLQEFERRAQKAHDYYDGIVAFKGQNMVGDVITNEGQTEINAMQARLAYAAHQDDFDYDAFFRGRAYLGRVLRTPEFELQCILGADSHPSGYLDINGPNQMFEEFYRTYDVQEGDGMYLAPEARLVFW